MKKKALIVAGGKGERMKSNIPKQFLLIKNLPVLMHTLKKFSHLEEVILVLPKTMFTYWKKLCAHYNFTQKHTLVSGGNNRFKSVQNGLKYIEDGSIVAIHDGVRPLISKKLINKLMSMTKKGECVIPVLPIKTSILKITSQNASYINRDLLYEVQTPQCFFSTDIKTLYINNSTNTFTDDASLFKYSGGKVVPINGEEENIKITTKKDLQLAELLS